MRPAVAMMMLLVVLVGCAPRRESEVKTEDGKVLVLAYVPRGHGTGVGTGISGNGGVATVVTSTTIPERWAVVFQCQHGSFTVEGETAHALFATLAEGDCVKIGYRIVERQNRSGVWEPIDLDFVNAIPVECANVHR